MKLAVVVAVLVAPGLAHADPATDAAKGAADLAAAIRAKDAVAIAKRLADPVYIGGIYFADAACAKRFPMASVAETGADKAAFARCLAQSKLQPTTRTSSLPSGAVLTVEPGIELELAFHGTELSWIGFVGSDSLDDRPTLTARAFEALRTAGSTNLDAIVKTDLAPFAHDKPVSAWLKICLDAAGAVTEMHRAFLDTTGTATVFIEAAGTWRFKPFQVNGAGIAVCSLALLTYPAAKAPRVETLPAQLVPKGKVKDIVQPVKIEKQDPSNGVEGGDDGTDPDGGYPPPPPPPPPQVVPPATLEPRRIKGDKYILPDAATKTEIERSGKDKVVGSFKMCLSTAGTVTSVTTLRSTGFGAYDAKITREMNGWAYRPFTVNGKAVRVCTAITFTYGVR